MSITQSTGIIRRIDDLGRIVIPREVRRNIVLKEGDAMEICITNEGILLKKYDETKPTEDILDLLKENIPDSCLNSLDIMEKISEIRELLKE